jgi:hypothetical protein
VMVSAAHRPEDAPGPAAAAASGVMGHERG